MNVRDTERLRLQADPYNRAVLAILDGAGSALHVEELAERLVRRGETVIRSAEYERRIDRRRLSLHHDRLPRLADAGLIKYDSETNTADVGSDPADDVEWLDGGPIDDVLQRVRGDRPADEPAIGVIEGRRSVIERGRRLADEADEELFCVYVSTDLLEEECIRRAEEAIDRGVGMYLGSRDADVRDLTRRELPEATTWEPQRDWMNAPTGSPRVGRLVLVDRRTVMLALIEDPTLDESTPDETAVIGEGEDNPLVVLVRELLGPRLDHLDFQSTDFRSELPS